ncbi:MAG: type II toxin-antitoxin system ParD family antitoxin [Pseudomonadota bacterium]
MPTRNVLLTEHQSALIDRLVAEGRFQNASEVLREGLRGLEDREEARSKLSTYLDALLDEADQTPEADWMPLDQVMARLSAKRPG